MEPQSNEWIQTYTGQRFGLSRLDPDAIRAEDIAHSLANTCRFRGHTKTFYSVAQHSVLVSRECRHYPLLGLLHDSSEAYLWDMSRPHKHEMRRRGIAFFDDWEEAVEELIWKHFGLWPVPEAAWAEVKVADELLLTTEARDFMSPLHADWKHRPENGFAILPERILPWTPGRAGYEFLKRLTELSRSP